MTIQEKLQAIVDRHGGFCCVEQHPLQLVWYRVPPGIWGRARCWTPIDCFPIAGEHPPLLRVIDEFEEKIRFAMTATGPVDEWGILVERCGLSPG